MSEILRGGVIGAGVFGGHHARQYARLPGAVLSAVMDPNPERAAALAMPLGGRAFTELDAFLDAVDVVTIASPAQAHAGQALAAIAAGKPVYIEKPIAVSLAESEAIGRAAQAAGVIVACGHQERVLFETISLFDATERPLRLEAVRHGPPSPRSLDVSVVLDLMIHDLDLALTLAGGGTRSVVGEGTVDIALAQVEFDGGLVARFDVSRRADARRRSMKLVYSSGEVEVDFVQQTFRNTTKLALNSAFASTPSGQDTLAVSLERFLAAVRGEVEGPLVGVEAAARALGLALSIEKFLTQ